LIPFDSNFAIVFKISSTRMDTIIGCCTTSEEVSLMCSMVNRVVGLLILEAT
jgi:hypothetical protein